MKLYGLIAGLSVSLGMVSVANAQVHQGKMDSYFSVVYATDLAGQVRYPQYDGNCDSKYWNLKNTKFSVDFRVNTDSATHAAFFTYANVEHNLVGTLDKATGKYVFKTDQLSQRLKDIHAKTIYFNLTNDFHWGTAQVVLEGAQVVKPHTHTDSHSMTTMDDPNCPCDCHKQEVVTYQCVLST